MRHCPSVRPSVCWSAVIELKSTKTHFDAAVLIIFVCECVWAGRRCGWGLNAPADPSATILWPCVICFFLVADTQFYKRLCPSVGPSVCGDWVERCKNAHLWLAECVWGGRGSGWGFHALAHPSATLLQPRVTCSHHSPHKILYSVQIIVSLNSFSIRHLSNRHACTISKEHLSGFSSGPVGYQNRVMGYFIWLVTFFIHQ